MYPFFFHYITGIHIPTLLFFDNINYFLYLFKTGSKELGTIIDNYLHNTFSGNKFHVKGEKVIEQIAQKLPKLTTI